MSSVQQLHQKSMQLEQQLRDELKKKAPEKAQLASMRVALQETNSDIILTDYAFAYQHECEHSLWKNVFYKRIEEFRKRLRKLAEAQSETPSVIAAESERVQHNFFMFLQTATVFYQTLYQKLAEKHLADAQAASLPQNPTAVTAVVGCHRCLIFLGDLARYMQLHSTGEKNWTESERYYERAAELYPFNGNPHNQLAVIATYNDDDLDGVYHYFRSIAVAQPFLTARENLILLFEKNRKKVAALPSRSSAPLATVGSAGSSNSGGKKKDAKGGAAAGPGPAGSVAAAAAPPTDPAQLQLCFLLRAVRLAGIVFTKTSLEQFAALQRDAVADLDALLRNGLLTDETLVLKLTTLWIFSLYNTLQPQQQPQQPQQQQQQQQHTDTSSPTVPIPDGAKQTFEASLSLAFDFFDQICRAVFKKPDERPFLSSISLFCEWLSGCPIILASLRPHTEEARHADAFWSALSNLLNSHLGSQGLATLGSAHPPPVLLPEERALCGFLPLLRLASPAALPLPPSFASPTNSAAASSAAAAAAAIPPAQLTLCRYIKITRFVSSLETSMAHPPIFFDVSKGKYVSAAQQQQQQHQQQQQQQQIPASVAAPSPTATALPMADAPSRKTPADSPPSASQPKAQKPKQDGKLKLSQQQQQQQQPLVTPSLLPAVQQPSQQPPQQHQQQAQSAKQLQQQLQQLSIQPQQQQPSGAAAMLDVDEEILFNPQQRQQQPMQPAPQAPQQQQQQFRAPIGTAEAALQSLGNFSFSPTSPSAPGSVRPSTSASPNASWFDSFGPSIFSPSLLSPAIDMPFAGHHRPAEAKPKAEYAPSLVSQVGAGSAREARQQGWQSILEYGSVEQHELLHGLEQQPAGEFGANDSPITLVNSALLHSDLLDEITFADSTSATALPDGDDSLPEFFRVPAEPPASNSSSKGSKGKGKGKAGRTAALQNPFVNSSSNSSAGGKSNPTATAHAAQLAAANARSAAASQNFAASHPWAPPPGLPNPPAAAAAVAAVGATASAVPAVTLNPAVLQQQMLFPFPTLTPQQELEAQRQMASIFASSPFFFSGPTS